MVLPIGYRGPMQRVEATTTLPATAASVFDFVSDLANLPLWMGGVRAAHRTSEGPMEVGATAHVSRVMLGQQIEAPLTVTAWDPPRAVSLSSAVSGVALVASMEIADDGAEACRLTLAMELMAGGLGAFMEPMLAQAAQADVTDSLERLRTHLAAA